jgi:lysophospholipase L1-like esterase
MRLRLLGDSIAAGVGSTRREDTLGPLLAARLRAAGRHVDLKVHAVPGARSADLKAQVRTAIAGGVDLAVIVIGANDLTRFVPAHVGAQQLHDAVADLRGAGAQVVVSTAPDLSVVAHVPPALRDVVSTVSRDYAQAQLQAVIRAGGVVAHVERASRRGSPLIRRCSPPTASTRPPPATASSPRHSRPRSRPFSTPDRLRSRHARRTVRTKFKH